MNMTAFAVALVVLIVTIVYFDIKGNKAKNEKGAKDISAVRVVDFEMPFGSMVVFMVKWAIASIPAIIILYVLFVLFGSILSGVVAGIAG